LGIITEISPCECEKVYFSVFFSIRTFTDENGEAGGDFFSFFLFFLLLAGKRFSLAKNVRYRFCCYFFATRRNEGVKHNSEAKNEHKNGRAGVLDCVERYEVLPVVFHSTVVAFSFNLQIHLEEK
jgi:hypothetical protein